VAAAERIEQHYADAFRIKWAGRRGWILAMPGAAWLRRLALLFLFTLSLPLSGQVNSISLTPQTATTAAGGSLTFTATVDPATTTTGAAVYWACSGGSFVSTNSDTVTWIAPTTPGVYSVTATAKQDAQFTATSSITVINQPPAITTHPANATVTAGQTASFSVTANGTAPLSYQWQKNGVAITGATSATYTTPATSTADSGSSYRVVVNNSAGSATSNAATLTVNPALQAPNPSYSPNSQTFTVGTAITTWTPSNAGGTAASWSISPALPAGLSFSSATGAISGTPSASSVATTYTVTATNAAGNGTTTITVTVAAAGGPPTNGLVAHWGFNEGSGTTANDSSGNGRTATLVNNPSWVAGKVGPHALGFNGGSQYVNAAPSGSLSGTFTVMGWANPSNTNPMDIVGTRGPGEYSFDMKFANGNLIHGDIGNGSSWITTSADASFSYTTGTWYHVAYVVTPTGYSIYVNGVLVGSGTYGTSTPLLYDSNHPIKIGQYGGGSEYFNGMIDEVRIYNRALNAAEIAACFTDSGVAAPSISYNPASLVATVGTAITAWTPSNAGGTAASWTISPALPAGLGFSTATGAISGTPSATSVATSYTVTASNAGGTGTTTLTITVNAASVAPSITAHPASATVTAGQTASFSVTASGTAPLSYQWQKNGTAIAGATAATYSTPATSLADSGSSYRVVVSNSAGSVTSNAAILTVNAVPAPTISGFTPASGTVGSSVILTGIDFTGATAVKFNGIAATFTVNSATQITATVPSGAGTGTLSVTNPGGTATSSGVFTVTAGPAINVVVTPSVVSLTTGASVSLAASVTSTANTAVTWSMSGGTLSDITATTVTWTAPQVAGTYTVTATSQADGTRSAVATFRVNPAVCTPIN
jgi:hypothetical protein